MNKSILSNILMFAVGAAVGSVVTWKLVDKKYSQIAEEEIQSIREFYAGDQDTEEDDEDENMVKVAAEEYARLIAAAGYIEEEDDEYVGPHVISYDDFDEAGYETEVLYCFADGVITDTMYNVIENPEKMIGPNIASHFGEEEEDVVYVRNDKLRLDIEVQRDLRMFSEVD